MKQEIVLGEMQISYPGEFQIMDDNELKRFFSGSDSRWGICDNEKHIMISVAKQFNQSFLGLLADAKSVARSAKLRLMRRMNSFSLEDDFTVKVCGKKAQGFKFSYLTNDAGIRQTAELIVFKYKYCFFSSCYITRSDDFNYYRPVYEEILQSIEI